MNRKYIACLVLLSFISFNILTPAQVYGWSLWPFGESDPTGKDATFGTIYPASFWDSTTWTVIKYAGVAIVIGAITYFTVGTGTVASVGVIAKFIGGAVGSWLYGLSGGAAIIAGLAFLGGGSIAAGGLGILGGVSVISAISSLALTAALDAAYSQVPSGTHRKTIALIKPRLFWDYVSPVVKSEMKDLKTTLEEISEGGTDEKAKHVEELLKTIDNKLNAETLKQEDDYTAYNFLFLAIIRYNMNDFAGAKYAVKRARKYIDPEKSSVLDYVDALLAFNDGDDNKGVNLLRGIIEEEPEAATPYIVLGQLAFDKQNYLEAFDILDRGLKATNDEVCVMSWMAGNSLYNAGRYKAAVPYYEKALKNMTINEYEALYKLNIAKCYRKLNNHAKGWEWLNDAISEVSGNKEMVEEIKKQYSSD